MPTWPWANFVFDLPRNQFSGVLAQRPTAGARGRVPSLSTSRAPPRHRPRPPRVLVLPDGTLLDVFLRVDFELGLGQLYAAARSLDEGADMAAAGAGRLQPDPAGHPPSIPRRASPCRSRGFSQRGGRPGRHCLRRLRKQHLGELGGDRRGEGRGTEAAPGAGASLARHQRVSRSSPRSRSMQHGTVGVTWYDPAQMTGRGDSHLSADVWFAHSEDRGGSWRQDPCCRPPPTCAPRRFPPTTSWASTKGWRRSGAAAFAAIFTLAAPQARNGPTDIFFARIGPG